MKLFESSGSSIHCNQISKAIHELSCAEAKFKSRNNLPKHPWNFSICAIYIQGDNSEDNDENVAEKEVEFHADDAKFMQLVSRNYIKTCSIVTNKFLPFFLSKSFYYYYYYLQNY